MKIKKILKVKGPTTIQVNKFDCYEHYINIPNSYLNKETTADLIIFVKSIFTKTNFLAVAAPCIISEENKRPLIGMIQINE